MAPGSAGEYADSFSPSRSVGHTSGPRVERAVVIDDDVGSFGMTAVEIVPTPPRRPTRPPPEGYMALAIESNEPQLAAAVARREEAELWERKLQGAMAVKMMEAQAEVGVVLKQLQVSIFHRRVDRIRAVSTWQFFSILHAFRSWALVLDLGDAYAAAIESASELLAVDSRSTTGVVESAQRTLVQLLLAKPEKLDELSQMRARLQELLTEVEAITIRLAHLRGHGGTNVLALRKYLPSDENISRTSGLLGTSGHSYEAATAHVVATTGLRNRGSAGLRAIDSERLALRLLLAKFRKLRLLCDERKKALASSDTRVKQLDVEVLHYRSLLSEAREECEMWRSQALTNAEELNNAGTREARRTLEHEEEVSCLSEKIRQLLEDHAALDEIRAQQAADLEVLTAEVMRMHATGLDDGDMRARR